MHHRGALLTGLGLSMALVYFLNPDRGRHRRARVRDRLGRAVRLGQTPVDDAALVQRVRHQMGYVVSHPHAIDVESTGGVVTLRGPILYAETAAVLSAVKLVRGVREVISELEEHKMTWNVPALQGGSRPPGLPSNGGRREWSSKKRLVTGTTGIALAGYGAVRHDARGAFLAAAGMALVARAAAA